jgi:large repetitive protein
MRGRTVEARRAKRTSWQAGLAALLGLLGLLLPGAGGVAHSQGGGPVIAVTESGQPLADGSWFNRTVTPVIAVTGGQAPVTVTPLLDGAAYTSGTPVSAPGTHQLAVTAVDAGGVPAVPVQIGFTIKTTPPVITVTSPASGIITAATQVAVTGTVDSAVSVTVGGQPATLSAGQSWSGGPVALAEGTNDIAVTAVDAAGNTATVQVVVVRDTTPPAVAIGQPAAAAVVGTVAVDVVGTAADAHLANVTVNGTAASVAGTTFRAPQVPLAEGSNSLTAVAVDQAGNSAQASVTVVRDTQPPVLTITSPANGTVVPGTSIAVSGTASDPHLNRVVVGGATATLSPAAGGSVTWSAPVTLQAGNNTITAQAVDVVGNASTATVSVVQNGSAPQVHIDQPVDGALLAATTVNVSGTVEQRNGLVVTVNGVPASIGSDGTSFSLAGVALVEGQNRLVARATDPAGNQGVHSILVTRDTTPPQLQSSDPASGAQAIPVTSAFRLTFSEVMATPASGSWTLQTAAGQAIAASGTLSTTSGGSSGAGGAGGSAAASVLTVQPNAALPGATSLQLVLTAGLTDLAGNGLGNPGTLTFTTIDTTAPAAPTVSAVPAYLCASSVTLTGTAAPGSTVNVTGGAAAAQATADPSSGQFSVVVLLTPASVNRLQVTAASATTGALSPPATVQVVQDCAAP